MKANSKGHICTFKTHNFQSIRTKTVVATQSPPQTEFSTEGWVPAPSSRTQQPLAAPSSCQGSRHSCHWGVAINCSWGPQFQAQRVLRWRLLGPDEGPRCRRGMPVVFMCVCNCGHGQGKPMTKATPTPDVVDDMMSATLPSHSPSHWGRRLPLLGTWMSTARDQEGAVAEAIAHPLGIQPSINKHILYDPSSR